MVECRQYRRAKPIITIAALCLCGIVASDAAALEFDCDVPANRFSSVSERIDGHAEISGKIERVLVRAGEYMPVVGARFTSQDETDGAGIQIIARSRNSKTYDVIVNVRIDGDLNRYNLGQIDVDEPVSFSLVIEQDGTLETKVGDLHFRRAFAQVQLDGAMAFCSTGQFKFKDLRFSGEPPEASTP